MNAFHLLQLVAGDFADSARIRLFCRDRFACERFETHVFSDYVDLNERRAGILEDIRRRGSVYG